MPAIATMPPKSAYNRYREAPPIVRREKPASRRFYAERGCPDAAQLVWGLSRWSRLRLDITASRRCCAACMRPQIAPQLIEIPRFAPGNGRPRHSPSLRGARRGDMAIQKPPPVSDNSWIAPPSAPDDGVWRAGRVRARKSRRNPLKRPDWRPEMAGLAASLGRSWRNRAHDPAPGNHPRQARRARPDRGRDRRVHRRSDQRRGHRGAGRRLRHGGVLQRHDARRAGRADPRHDAVRRDDRLARAGPAGPDPRQAFDRRRRRQRVAHARPDAGGLRRLRADDLGPRPRPHRRHARQARFDPGLSSPSPIS